jgi:hypothetical protein
MKRMLPLPANLILTRKRQEQQQQQSSSSSEIETGSLPNLLSKTSQTITVTNNNDVDVPYDSVSAFEAIVRQVSTTSGFPLAIPGCFLHQIYSIISDKTIVNQDLQEMRRKGELRQLHVEHCGILIVREKDYRSLVGTLLNSANLDRENAELEAKVLDKFIHLVLPQARDLAISKARLEELLGLGSDRTIMLVLQRLGFIVFQTHGPNVDFVDTSYWFSLPNMGVLITEIEQGRKELVNIIQKQKPHKEIFLSKLQAKHRKLKGSSLSLEYHLKDAIGMGIIVARDTAIEGKSSLFLLPDKLTS